jgi:hypothetical protein
MTQPGADRKRLRRSYQKPWNSAALILALLSILLLALAVFSVDNRAKGTGDYLELTASSPLSRQARGDLLNRGRLPKKEVLELDRQQLKDTQMKVSVGIYAMNNYGIDPQVPSFDSTGYMWFKWGDELQQYLVKTGLDIWKVMAPVNLLDIPQSADTVMVPTGTDKPIKMKDGTWYQTVAYKGKFFIDRKDFRRHPFTRLSLPIMIEADDILLSYGNLRIVPDLQGSGIGQYIDTNTGWINLGWSMAEYKHHYDTDFGFGEGASDYSQLVFDVRYASDPWSAFWKILIPLATVMAMVVGATKMDPVQWEVRLTMPVTVLLTLVFLQQSQDSGIPKLPYLTFLDEIYVVSYTITLGSFLLMLWGCRRYYSALALEDPVLQQRELARLDRSDDYWPAAVILAGMISVTICWFTN